MRGEKMISSNENKKAVSLRTASFTRKKKEKKSARKASTDTVVKADKAIQAESILVATKLDPVAPSTSCRQE